MWFDDDGRLLPRAYLTPCVTRVLNLKYLRLDD